MTERLYWNEGNSLAVVVEGDLIGTLINLDTELYGIPNPDREVMMERWCLLSQNPSLHFLLKELESIPMEPSGWMQYGKIHERSQKIREISSLIWPSPGDDY